jgi:hypothetical protein
MPFFLHIATCIHRIICVNYPDLFGEVAEWLKATVC